MTESTIGFIGLGLIGGSIARGLKRANNHVTIMAYMRTRSKLEQAKADGIVDVILDGIDETLSQCDMVFLCTPVEYNASGRALQILRERNLLMGPELEGAEKVLKAAALTYVASLFSSILQLLRLVLLTRSSRRRD